MLHEIVLKVQEDFATHENENDKILHANALKLLHRMPKAKIIYCLKFARDLSELGHKLNLFDSCVANKTINAAQHAKTLHVDPKVNSKFTKWARLTCRSSKLGHAKVCIGKKYNYLGMIIDH